MDEKVKRHGALRKLLIDKPFSCQDDVVLAMENLGFDVTQSSISRDFRDLKIIKVGGQYLPSSSLTNSKGKSPYQQMIQGIDTAGANLLVIKTVSGAASIIADKIDSESPLGVAGTVAGDNTIFVATKNKAAQTKVISMIKEL